MEYTSSSATFERAARLLKNRRTSLTKSQRGRSYHLCFPHQRPGRPDSQPHRAPVRQASQSSNGASSACFPTVINPHRGPSKPQPDLQCSDLHNLRKILTITLLRRQHNALADTVHPIVIHPREDPLLLLHRKDLDASATPQPSRWRHQ